MAKDWTDLLAPVDVTKLKSGDLKWQRAGTTLIEGGDNVPADKGGWAGIVLGSDLAGDYDFETDFVLVDTKPQFPMYFDLPVQDTIVSVAIDSRPGFSGLNNVDGKLQSIQEEPPSLKGLQKMKTSVRNQGDHVQIDVFLNDAPFASFSGLRSRLPFPPPQFFPARNKVKITGYVAISQVGSSCIGRGSSC